MSFLPKVTDYNHFAVGNESMQVKWPRKKNNSIYYLQGDKWFGLHIGGECKPVGKFRSVVLQYLAFKSKPYDFSQYSVGGLWWNNPLALTIKGLSSLKRGDDEISGKIIVPGYRFSSRGNVYRDVSCDPVPVPNPPKDDREGEPA